MSDSLLRKTVSQLARGMDHAFSGGALKFTRSLRRRSHDASREPASRLRALEAIGSFYARPEFLTRDNALLQRPAAIAPSVRRVRTFRKVGEVLDLTWPSAFEPLWSGPALLEHAQQLSAAERARLGLDVGLDDIVRSLGVDRTAELREKYANARANQTAHARWFRHTSGLRPCVVLIHGYMSGHYAIEARMWPLKRLFEGGFDVVLSVLPFHGARRAETRGYLPPDFPSSDLRFTIEGFRQVVSDHRALFGHLLSGRVASLGVMGMSLGGYSAALLATLEAALQFAVLLVPLAAIEDVARRMPGTALEQAAERAALRRALQPISPFTRASLVPGERVFVLAGEVDQVIGNDHAQRLAEHFSAQLSLFHGGHLLQAGRDEALAPVWRLLSDIAGEAL